MNLWPIGNCQVSALIDGDGRYVWGCVPRVDGDPAFCALLGGDSPETGYWSVEMEGAVRTSQSYLRNTPILLTRHEDDAGNAVEVVDFAPRYFQNGRQYRPTAFARIVRPAAGTPRIRSALRVATDWGKPTDVTRGSNHVRFLMRDLVLRLTTNASIDRLRAEEFFRLERELVFFLGPDESFVGKLDDGVRAMLDATRDEWRHWVRGLAVPLEWQEVVTRAAITLKLCQHEETGAIVAAMTTSLPEYAGSGRNWDYRYCWVRDAYYTVQALNRLGALDVLEGYLEYLRNIVDASDGGHVQPLYGVGGEARIPERIEHGLPGYRGMGPVRVGNEAYSQVQHDAYGQIVLSNAQAFHDRRLLRVASEADFRSLEEIGERAWNVYDTPDAGLWELRTKSFTHTYSAAMCWAACDRLSNAADALGLGDRREFWAKRAATMHARIEQAAWREDSARMSATFEGDDLDASLIELLDLRFFEPGDPRFRATLDAVEHGLRRGIYMLRYDSEDDFGLPHTAFTVCTFWLIEALEATGRHDDARALFEEMVGRRTPAGLLSEDIDPKTDALWGNYPQTYSLVGLINCAVLLSKPWSAVR